METMNDFIERIRGKYDIQSDYGLAKILKVTRNAISAHKHKRSKHFSEETAYKIAELLDLDPAYVMSCLAAERAKDVRVRETWQRVSKILRVASLPALIFFVSNFVPTKDVVAGSVFSISHNVTYYTLCVIKWLKKWSTCLISLFWCRLPLRRIRRRYV